MIDMRSQPSSSHSTAPTDDDICDHVLGTRSSYVKGLGRGFTAPSSSRSSRPNIHASCHAQIQELQSTQTQMMERMVQMERMLLEMMAQQAGPSSDPTSSQFPPPVHDPPSDADD